MTTNRLRMISRSVDRFRRELDETLPEYSDVDPLDGECPECGRMLMCGERCKCGLEEKEPGTWFRGGC
jgi:hypothetical protein